MQWFGRVAPRFSSRLLSIPMTLGHFRPSFHLASRSAWRRVAFDCRRPLAGLPGPPQDRHEGFAADHRLAFRGLLAEGLGDQTLEAASFPTPLGTNGELGLQSQEVLSLAAWSLSNAGDATRDAAAASLFGVGDRLGCAAAMGPGQAFSRAGFLSAGR